MILQRLEVSCYDLNLLAVPDDKYQSFKVLAFTLSSGDLEYLHSNGNFRLDAICL